MLGVGDVIELDDFLGVVRRIDRQLRLAIVQKADQTTIEIENDLDYFEPKRCMVVCNPARDWPFIKVPDRPRLGAFLGLTRAGEQTPLVVFRDWMPTEFGKTGSVFLNPGLALGVGDILVVRHEKGNARLDVPRNYGSVAQRIARRDQQDEGRADAEARAEEERNIPAAYRLLTRDKS